MKSARREIQQFYDEHKSQLEQRNRSGLVSSWLQKRGEGASGR